MTPRQEKLLEKFMPLARAIALAQKARLPRHVLTDDLIAAAMVGLWDAVLRHSKKRDDDFVALARSRIRGAIQDELRRQDPLPRYFRKDEEEIVHIPIDEIAPLPGLHDGTEERIDLERACARLRKALEILPPRELEIIKAYFLRGTRLSELGLQQGVNEVRIGQIRDRALGRLRRHLRRKLDSW